MRLPLSPSNRVTLGFAAVAFLNVLPAQAQDTPDTQSDGAAIEEIVVRGSGSRLPTSIASFPGSVTVIDQQAIEQQAAFTSDVATILAFEVPGLGTSANSSSNFRQRLRGRKVAVFIDGIPVSAPLRNASRDFRVLDTSAVGGIEVIRGSTALYGNGGAGGSINYLTKQPTGEDGFKGNALVSLGSSLTHAGDSYNPLLRLNLEAIQGGFDFIFSGSYEQIGNLFDADGDRIPVNPTGNGGSAESDVFSGYAKAGYNWGGVHRVEASLLTYDQDQDSDYLLLDLGSQQTGVKTTAVLGQLDPRDEQEFNRNDLAQLSYHHSDLLGGTMRLQYYHQKLDQQFSWNPVRAGGSNSRIESEKDGFRLDFETPLTFLGGDASTLLWGTEYAIDTSEQSVNSVPRQTFVPPLEQTDTALFAQLFVDATDRLTLQGGVRYDDLTLDLDSFTVLGTGLNVMGGSVGYDATVFNLGAVFRFTDQFEVFGGFSQGFSLPDVGRTLRTTTDTDPFVNVRPEPVEIDNYEIGLRFDTEAVSGTLAYFFSTSDLGERFITDPNAPPGVIELIVGREAQDFWGIEATVIGPLPGGRGQWGGSVTWIDAEIDSDGDGDPDAPIGNNSIGPIKITAFADYNVTEDWSFRTQALYSGDRNEFPDVAFISRSDMGRVESFWTLDASTNLRWGPGELSIAVSNLFNNDYFPAASWSSGNQPEWFAAAPGAMLKIGYRLEFE